MKREYAKYFSICKVALIVIFLLSHTFSYAQKVDEIKSKISEYAYGEGEGATLSSADDAALVDLLRKISVTVKGDFVSRERETTSNSSFDSETTYESIIRTYTNATLTNTERIIIKPEPDARVLRFIRRSEIDRIFESRKSKVYEFIEIADAALSKQQIDDALRYYYWAYSLVKSLRYPNEAKKEVDGKERLLITWIPTKLEEIFRDISINAKKTGQDTYEISARYCGKSIRSMDYSYFNGRDNSAIYSVKDGMGQIEMNSGLSAQNANVKVEYEFLGLAVTDREVESVLKSQEPSVFKKAYYSVYLPNSAQIGNDSYQASNDKITGNASSELSVTGTKDHFDKLQKINSSISSNQTASIRNLFTNEGWQDFSKILSYGKIQTLANQEVDFFQEGDETISRGLSCIFKFSNNRTFNEQLSFTFDKSGKISHVALGLGKQMAEEEILSHGAWSEFSRKKIVSFLEDYRTAYATKDIDFMERVFDDNAVIIVGRKLQAAPQMTDGRYLQNEFVKLTRYSKEEFIKHLRSSFKSKSYINLHFSNCEVIQLKKGVERYGIQVKQDYYSSNYGDTGYLYLLVDLEDPKNPIIHVRTWQENPDPNFGVIGPGHF